MSTKRSLSWAAAAFVVSAAFVGLAGGLYGPLARQITPDQLHWLFSAQLVLATVLGGTRDFLGPLLGAFAHVALVEVSSSWIFGRQAILGLLLIAVVLVFPRRHGRYSHGPSPDAAERPPGTGFPWQGVTE